MLVSTAWEGLIMPHPWTVKRVTFVQQEHSSCVQGSSYYEPCADGDYMNHTQADACYTCPARYYCYSNKINPLPCPMGYFCPLGTALPDDLCPIVSTRPLYIRSVQMAGPKLLNGSNAADAPSVGTKPTASLINGSTAILPCHYTQSVYGIYWTKQNGHSEPGGDTLVHLDTYFHVGSRCGRGVEEGRFNISDDLSLIINPVKMHDGGRYSCKVSDITSGMTYSNDTDVTVYVYAKKKYVTIKPCEHLTNLNQSEDLRETPCAYDVPDNQTRFQLNCSVSGAMPKVSLTWMTNGTNVGMHYDLTSMSEDRGDGTFDQTLVITGSVNETRIGTVLTCMAKGLSVGGLANSSVIFVKTEPQNIQPDTQDTMQKPHVAAIVVPIIVCLVLLAAAVGIVWNRRSKQETASNAQPTGSSEPLSNEIAIQ